jgi:uncharacterized protein (DUF433 family)
MCSSTETEIVPGVTASSDVAFGKPVIAGTRVPVDVVLGHLGAGMSDDEIGREYDLTLDQIRAALRYAAWLAAQETIRVSAG